jgi:hypothetical protein
MEQVARSKGGVTVASITTYEETEIRRLSNWVSRGSIFSYPEVIAGRPLRMDCSVQALIVNPIAGGITCFL